MSKVKVLWVAHESDASGASKSMLTAIEGLKELGYESIVILPQFGTLAESLLSKGFRIIILQYRWWQHGGHLPKFKFIRLRRLLRNLIAEWDLYRILKIEKPSITISNTSVIPLGLLSSYALKIPHVHHYREFGWEDHRLNYDFGKFITTKIVGFFSDRIFTVSEAVASKYSQILSKEKFRVIHSGISISKSTKRNLPEDFRGFNLLYLNRISSGKGVEDGIKALSQLKGKGNFYLRIVGNCEDGVYQQFLNDLVIELDLSEVVDFVGFSNNPLYFLELSDVLISSSISEAFGRNIIEAMLVKTNVIGTNSGGTPEQITHLETGLLYEPGNYEELALNIKLLYEDREMKDQLRTNAYKYSNENFSEQHYIKRFHQALSEVIDY